MSRFRALTRNLLPHPRDLTDIFPKIRLHGLHLARYIGQDGVKSLVTGEEVNGQNVTWDDERVLAAAQSFADFAKKGYFSKNIATNVYPAGQNQEFAPGDAARTLSSSHVTF